MDRAAAVRTVANPSPAQFQALADARRPVRLTGVVDSWPARRWDLDLLSHRFGERTVPVEVWPGGLPRDPQAYLGGRRQLTLTVEALVARLRQGGERATRFYLAQYPLCRDLPELAADLGDLSPFMSCGPVPGWLRARFDPVLFVGPAGAFTPLHYDLNRGLVVQLCGHKKITFFPPHTWSAFGVPTRDLPAANFSPHNLAEIDGSPVGLRLPRAVCVAGPGDVVYVPYGWVHQVESLDPSISLSYAWYSLRDGPARLRQAIRHAAGRLRWSASRPRSPAGRAPTAGSAAT
jgi:lysine-specific demethylase 8